MTGTPSSARESMVSRYSSTGWWYSACACSCSPAMAVSVPSGGGRHIERGIAVEEAHRDEAEPGVLDRHDGPVFWPRDVGHPERVPEHDVGVDDWPVLGRPCRQAGTALVLVGVVPRGPALIGGAGGDPDI